MPRYVTGPFAPLCCVYSGFGGIPAILSGGNPPRYKTNHSIVSSFAEEIVSIPKNYSITREWCGMLDVYALV